MRFIFLVGGAVGFATAVLTDWMLDRGPDRILFDGAVGCLAGALLLRWFWRVLLGGIRDTYLARHRAAMSLVPAAVAAPVSGPSAPAKPKA
jgi:hypothetical protein